MSSANGNNPTFASPHYCTQGEIVGKGNFSVVYRGKFGNGKDVAIKKIKQSGQCVYNKELDILQQLDHCNIVKLLYSIYSYCDSRSTFLNIILEYMPYTLAKMLDVHRIQKQILHTTYTRLFTYQMLRALAYLHGLGIAHRDIKPTNLLVNPDTGVLKICDFGNSKKLESNEKAQSYVCSRWYRAPELIIGSLVYTCKVDVWSAGCVLAEMLGSRPIFHSDSSLNLLLEIIKIRGTPSIKQLIAMNPACATKVYNCNIPLIAPRPWHKVFGYDAGIFAVSLVMHLLEYSPEVRISAIEAVTFTFFDELRNPEAKLPNDRPLPPLFNFNEAELQMEPKLIDKLIPARDNEAGPSNSRPENV